MSRLIHSYYSSSCLQVQQLLVRRNDSCRMKNFCIYLKIKFEMVFSHIMNLLLIWLFDKAFPNGKIFKPIRSEVINLKIMSTFIRQNTESFILMWQHEFLHKLNFLSDLPKTGVRGDQWTGSGRIRFAET